MLTVTVTRFVADPYVLLWDFHTDELSTPTARFAGPRVRRISRTVSIVNAACLQSNVFTLAFSASGRTLYSSVPLHSDTHPSLRLIGPQRRHAEHDLPVRRRPPLDAPDVALAAVREPRPRGTLHRSLCVRTRPTFS